MDTLVYVGPLNDMTFPMYKTNILIEMTPEYSYFKSNERAYAIEKNLLSALRHIMFVALPDAQFQDHEKQKLWEWKDVKT